MMTGKLVNKEAKIDLLENPVLIYYDEVHDGDGEHTFNIHFLTGFYPRFREALFKLEKGKMILGNECHVCAGMIT